MADNVPITAGSGTTIGTDEVTIGGILQHVQRIKLVDGADGGTGLIGGDATNGLDVDVTRSALPTGASTETTLGTRLSESDFDTKTGALTETAPATDTASSGLNGRLQRVAQRLTSLLALLPTALGAGGGLKVDGSGTALPVSGTLTVNAGTNLNTSALALEAGHLATIDTKTPSLGQALAASSVPITLTALEEGLIGALTETAPATDTASSGLNGRLQRIAQRLTSIIALLPAALGTGGGLKVDGSGTALPVSGTVTANAGTGTLATSVADGSNVSIGALADAAVTAGATGSLSAKLRSISRDIVANIVLATGTNIIGKVGIDQTTVGTTNRIVAGGVSTRVLTALTRPADTTAYTAKDAIANATTSPATLSFTGVARTTGGSGYIVKAMILTSLTTCVETFKLHLYNAAPTALNDNAACTAPLYADAASYVGTILFPACATEGTGSTAAYAVAVPGTTATANLPLKFVTNADANLYGLLEAVIGFTPASAQTFSIILSSEVD
ncbi:MAG: hypothetical protein H0U60_13815 [Blastocatellia bacterium]|nr:hypothetical protein [Blastocatellia bacterium]